MQENINVIDLTARFRNKRLHDLSAEMRSLQGKSRKAKRRAEIRQETLEIWWDMGHRLNGQKNPYEHPLPGSHNTPFRPTK